MPFLTRIRPQDMVEAPDMQFIFPLPSLSLTHFFPLLGSAKTIDLLLECMCLCVCVCVTMRFQFRCKLFKIKECLFLYGYSQ